MKNEDVEERLARNLSNERFRHSHAVALLARELAERHGVDSGRVWIAGLLHDCAKDESNDLLGKTLRRAGSERWKSVKDYPSLWHAHVGAIRARREYGVGDREVLAAIRHHPTGHPGFGTLGHVLFVADYCATGRRTPGRRELLGLARSDLLAAVEGVVRQKIEHLCDRRRTIHPDIINYWNAVVATGNKDRAGECNP